MKSRVLEGTGMDRIAIRGAIATAWAWTALEPKALAAPADAARLKNWRRRMLLPR
jgi:hypothetical protein